MLLRFPNNNNNKRQNTMTRFFNLAVLAALSQRATAEVCQSYSVDFSQFARGEYLTNQLQKDYGIEINCSSEEGHGCRIFDTSVPYGEWVSGSGCKCSMESCSESKKNDCGDPDLGAPHFACPGGGPGEGEDGGPDAEYPNCEPRGNVLIIDENGPGKPPDDSKNGGKIRFNFAYPTDLEKICFLDVDAKEMTYVSVSVPKGHAVIVNETACSPLPRLCVPL